MRWALDPDAVLAEDSLAGLVNASGRAVRRAFRADPSRTRSVRYRFELDGPTVSAVDVVLAPEGASFEIESTSRPYVTFRCASATYGMIIFGRWKLPDVMENGRLTADGDEQLVAAFVDAFVGG